MKTLPTLLSLSIMLSFTSCTSYYYSQLSSNNIEVEKAENGELVIENDTVSIAYSFYGENAPITITIHNKINRPLYVDWTKSALIIDDVATAYKESNMYISGTSNSSGYSDGGSPSDWRYNSSEGKFSGTITASNDAQFIPPKSKIVNTPLELTDFPFDNYPNNKYKKKNFYGKNGKREIKVMNFTEENSPLCFRSFLTIYDPINPSQPMSFENQFYISQLTKAGSLAPNEFYDPPKNTFYVKKEKGKNAGAITAIIALSAASIAIDVAAGNSGN